MIKGGDFNARTAEKGKLIWDGEEEGNKRYSKDKIMNKQGIDLLENIEKMETRFTKWKQGRRRLGRMDIHRSKRKFSNRLCNL